MTDITSASGANAAPNNFLSPQLAAALRTVTQFTQNARRIGGDVRRNIVGQVQALGAQAHVEGVAFSRFIEETGLPFAKEQTSRGWRLTKRVGGFARRKALIPWCHINQARRNILPRQAREAAGYLHVGAGGALATTVIAGAFFVSGAAADMDARARAPIYACQNAASAALTVYTGHWEGETYRPGRYAELTRLTGIYPYVPHDLRLAISDACHDSAIPESVPAAVANGALPAVREWTADLDARLTSALAAETARQTANDTMATELAAINADMPRRRAEVMARQQSVIEAHRPEGRVTGCIQANPDGGNTFTFGPCGS